MTDIEDREDTIDGKRAAYSAPALEKGLDILELLAASDQAMTTGQIAEGLGRSKNEIFRMVFVLENRNYLVRDPATDMLRLSNRLFQMGLRTPRTRQLTEVAVPAMEALSEAIGHSSHLVVVNRGETVVIATAAGGADVGFALRLGYRRAAIEASSGQTIIAFQVAEMQQRLVAESRALAQEKLVEKKLIQRLRGIREQGYLIAPSHDITGVTDICAPILDQSDRALAAIVVTCLQRVKTADRHNDIAESLVATCRTISSSLQQAS
jgi:DNA-binding IclR family transcriptional regulator